MDKATIEACAKIADEHPDTLESVGEAGSGKFKAVSQVAQKIRALAEQDDKKATGKHRLVYNKTTKRIEKVNTVTGLVTESFEPPIECEFAAPGEGNFRTTPAD